MGGSVEWFDLKGILALSGFLISLISLYFTWQNRKLAVNQEKRRAPLLVPALINGFFRRADGGNGRLYALHLTVSNPTDANNAISNAELAITYLTIQRVELTVRLKANDPKATSFVLGQEDFSLSVPFTITAHNAVSGWLRFHLPAKIFETAEIQTYRLILTDAHQQSSEIAPNLMQEYRDETAV